MNKAVFILLVLLAAGCTTAGDIRRQCAEQAATFGAEVACFEAMVAQDPGLGGDSFVQEYMLSGRVLAEKVAAGGITENEARKQLTAAYNDMLLSRQRYSAYNAMEFERLRPRHTVCHQSGDRIFCDTY